MKVTDSPLPGLPLSASLRAQESRKAYGKNEAVETPRNDRPAPGKETPTSGKELPENAVAAQSAQSAETAKGLANAIEQLQNNSAKNPQANGLLRALESLTERQNTAQAVDTEV